MKITLARHGQTEWSRSGRHTGRNDIPLAPEGEEEARLLGLRLQKLQFARVLTSPLKRARQTCDLAGYGSRAEAQPDLVEWNYGDFEGLRYAEIKERRPGWELFRDGCPAGETPAEVVARADRTIASLKVANVDTLIFAHGHFLRVLTSRWIEQPVLTASRLSLSPASCSVLGIDSNTAVPLIQLWNDTSHLLR